MSAQDPLSLVAHVRIQMLAMTAFQAPRLVSASHVTWVMPVFVTGAVRRTTKMLLAIGELDE
jgi:hypothetical protein